jgi:hypothetical protein
MAEEGREEELPLAAMIDVLKKSEMRKWGYEGLPRAARKLQR